MKYHSMDFLACPSCKHFPLTIIPTREIIENFEVTEHFYQCEQYCGNHKIDLKNYGTGQIDCNLCEKKTIIEGFLTCEKCGMIFFVENGIPRLIKDELKSEKELQIIKDFSSDSKFNPVIRNCSTDSFEITAKKSEMTARAQYDEKEIIDTLTSDYHQLLKKIEFEYIVQALEIGKEDILLDNGTGYGIFSIPLIHQCRYIVATDLTYETLLAFKSSVFKITTEYFSGLSRFPEEKICLVQADSCNLPFRQGFQFDRVICAQVISHIPNPEGRKKAIEEIYNYISRKGIVVFTVGNDDLIHKVMRKIRRISREKLIQGGKGVGYYYKFQKSELMELIDTLFKVETCFGCQSQNALYVIFKINKKWAQFLERVIKKSPFSLMLGEVIFVSCKRR